MYAIFDKFNNRRIPSLVLCSPNGKKLYAMPDAKNRSFSKNLVELSELSFEVYRVEDENGDVQPYYDLLEGRRLVSIDSIGQFIITNVDIESDGIKEYKKITCKGLEFEISSKNIDLLEQSYSFYSPSQTDKSLMNIILSYIPNWTIGEIDADLWNVKRYLEINKMNLYNFMLNEVQDSYECIFIFD